MNALTLDEVGVSEADAAQVIYDLRRKLLRAEAAIAEVAHSGVEFEDDRIKYVTVQIDRDLWSKLGAWR